MEYNYKGVPGPYAYDDGFVFQDFDLKSHIVHFSGYFDEEMDNATGHLFAASPLLLSALINIFNFPQQYLQKWRTEEEYINISITRKQLNDALTAIEAALNLKTVEK